MPSEVRTSPVPNEIPWDRLSDHGAFVLAKVVLPISLGLSHAEIGDRLGKSSSWVAAQMKALRQEITRISAEPQ